MPNHMFSLLLVTIFILGCYPNAGDCKASWKIANGISPKSGEFKSIVSVAFRNTLKTKCGGSLIDKVTILTAASCLWDYPEFKRTDLKSLMIVLSRIGDNGENKLIKRNIKHATPHSDFNPGSKSSPKPKTENNIAIITLKKPILESKSIRYTVLPRFSVYLNHFDEVTIVGWGFASNREPSNSLKKGKMEVEAKNECAKLTDDKSMLKKAYFCAKSIPSGACSGDTGSPVYYREITDDGGADFIKTYVQYGVVNYFVGCGTPNHLTIGTETTPYLAWIKEAIAVASKKPEQHHSNGLNGNGLNDGMKTQSNFNFLRVQLLIVVSLFVQNIV